MAQVNAIALLWGQKVASYPGRENYVVSKRMSKKGEDKCFGSILIIYQNLLWWLCEGKISNYSLFKICRKSCFVLWCVGGWEELEGLGYIEPIEPNRGTPRATKLVNFNMLNHHQAHNIKKMNEKNENEQDYTKTK